MYEAQDNTELFGNDLQGQHAELEVPEPIDHWSIDDFGDLLHAGRTMS
ncbi:MAG: hypothetical protein PVI91_11815 [Gammaproteobacteria bacterium]|jgi:hypothetical protein